MCLLDSRLSILGSIPGQGHCVVFLCKTRDSHSASLHPGVQMVTGECNDGGTLPWTSMLSWEGVEMLLVAPGYKNWK